MRLENTSCWITSAEDYNPLMFLYKTPRNNTLFSLWLPFAEKGSDEKVKIEGKICSERAAKAMEEKTVYNPKNNYQELQKPRKIKKPKPNEINLPPLTKTQV